VKLEELPSSFVGVCHNCQTLIGQISCERILEFSSFIITVTLASGTTFGL